MIIKWYYDYLIRKQIKSVNKTCKSLINELLNTPPMLCSASIASTTKGILVLRSATSKLQLRYVELEENEDKIELREIQQE
jgi:hypothetical protein